MKQRSNEIKAREGRSYERKAGGKAPAAASGSASALTLAEQAYRRIEEMIITLHLAPGTVLSEMGLSESLGIGRTPIREALQRLAGEGLVAILPKRGVFVTETNIVTQLRLLELRREVQRLLAKLAAERASSEERAGFARIVVGMVQAAKHRDESLFAQLDRELDERMWESARNEFIVKTMALMRGLSRRFWFEHYQRAGDLSLAATLHARLAEAISKGDSKGAATASDRLIDYIESFSRETIEM